ncbi:mas-related G-protein coupled receptor member H-like [Dryobates pubescens]|uniref:mas-related G-protein coupled receptor member H-like n=1 Tax=Dryobates pubescens TaxID=118200 RepID=UPI0023B958AC|nr:mas-related G-protein coupled receptor member H-like [Dryobates pubescens]
MEETITTDLSLRFTTTTYPELEESNYDWCKTVSEDVLVIACVCSCISMCGLVGNVWVLWLLGFRMKQNPFTVYVLNLAIADFLLLLILLAQFTFHFLSSVYCIDHGDFLFTDESLFLLFLFCYFAGMYLLTAMSVEQCLAALFPVWYRCHRPKHCSAIMCGVLWTLAALFVALLFLIDTFGSGFDHIPYVLCIVNFLLFFFFPLLSNLVLFLKLRCGSQRRHPGKLYVAVLLSVLFLVGLGIPFSVEILISFYHPQQFDISFLLASLNSSINPVIYFLLGSCRQRHFQCSLTAAFQRLFEEGATSEERSQVPGDAVMETSV